MTTSPLAALPARFVGSFPDPAHPLDPRLPEIALVGRSNVGKSSLLNAVVGQRGLARVSGTPGKTQFLNVYALPGFYLVDLPGYGWARAAKRDRAAYRTLVQTYLRRRETLRGVVWLLDVRHAPSDHDLEMQALLAESGRPVLTVLTKADKLAQGKRSAAIKARAAELGLAVDELHPTSSNTGMGIADLGESILAAAGEKEEEGNGERGTGSRER